MEIKTEKLPAEQYQMIMDVMPITTVEIIFFNPDKTKVLLGKRTNEPLKGIFYTMGGRLLKNETFVEAAIRQAKVEAGLNISPDLIYFGGINDEIHTHSAFPNINYHAANIFYGTIIDDQKITLDNQHSEYAWLDITDPTLHPNIKYKVNKTAIALTH